MALQYSMTKLFILFFKADLPTPFLPYETASTIVYTNCKIKKCNWKFLPSCSECTHMLTHPFSCASHPMPPSSIETSVASFFIYCRDTRRSWPLMVFPCRHLKLRHQWPASFIYILSRCHQWPASFVYAVQMSKGGQIFLLHSHATTLIIETSVASFFCMYCQEVISCQMHLLYSQCRHLKQRHQWPAYFLYTIERYHQWPASSFVFPCHHFKQRDW